MAGDWIKVEKVTPDKPEMRIIARVCGVSRAEAFLAWFRLWCHFDDMIENGFLEGFTIEDADEMGRLPKLGEALRQTGWVIFEDHGCTVNKWQKHNGASAKIRAEDARRKQESRERKADAASENFRTNVRNSPDKCPEKSGQNWDQRREEQRRGE